MSLNENPFTVVPKASIRPNKIVFYNQILKRNAPTVSDKVKISPDVKKDLQAMGVPVHIMPVATMHSFDLSIKAKSRIRQKVTWLYSLAKTNSVKHSNGKMLHAFKMNFITLTLPAVQEHQTSQITGECLNQFLTECKARFNLQNYVWRLEFQKNGNAHYHIATDCFIEYHKARTIWNRCLDKLGYIDRYKSQFKGMTLQQYCDKFNKNGETPFNVLKTRFTYGQASHWENPNTVDVRSVGNAKHIAFYISKYITKDADLKNNKIVSDREPAETNLRLWFCSRSLSRLDKIEYFLETVNELADKALSGLSGIKQYFYDYVKVWYFELKEQSFETKASLWLLYNNYARGQGYVAWKPL